MDKKDTGGTAFPEAPGPGNQYEGANGMTLRDYFAAKTLCDLNGAGSPENIAQFAYAVADAMIKERNK